MNTFDYFGLQMFADEGTYFKVSGGTLVNTTQNYVNAYTGAETAFGSGNPTLNPLVKDFYDTELLENTRMGRYYAQFAQHQALPAKHAGKVQWRKFNTFEKAKKLQEGVIPTGQKMGMTAVEASINQYGTYVTVSDKLELRGYDDVILAATEEMGASYNETDETLIRDFLMTGTNVIYCDNVNTTSSNAVVGTPTGPTLMGATAASWSLLTRKMIKKVVTKMKKDKVPKINGSYVAVIHPSVAEDLRNDPQWEDAHKYDATTEIFTGEIGQLEGVRFIENADAPVLGATSAYQNAASGVTYATFFFGANAYAMIDPAGGNLQMIIHDKDEAGGPLDQFSTIGYKFETGFAFLYPERLVRVMSCSSYSASDSANGTL